MDYKYILVGEPIPYSTVALNSLESWICGWNFSIIKKLYQFEMVSEMNWKIIAGNKNVDTKHPFELISRLIFNELMMTAEWNHNCNGQQKQKLSHWEALKNFLAVYLLRARFGFLCTMPCSEVMLHMINKFLPSRKPTDLKKNSRQMNPEGACRNSGRKKERSSLS